MKVTDLNSYGASQELIDALAAAGLNDLYPPQILALKAGLLAGSESFIIAAPTASGKTLIAEMAALKVYFEQQGKILYTVPLKALAREKYEELLRKYVKTGMKIAQSTGDFDRADPWLRKADLIITTNEKIDSLLRHRPSWLADVRLAVTDEVHLIGDAHRGPTLEVVLMRLRQEMPKLRIVALSATIPNAEELAGWLGARLVASDWRPVPLREGVYFDGAAIFNDGTVAWVTQETKVDAIDLALGTIREGGQALVFVNTRKAAEAAASKAAPSVSKLLTDPERAALQKLAEKTASESGEPTRLSGKIAQQVAQGVSFHHAGILSSQRKLIEDGFRQNRIKLLTATTTLAMGLNLPSRRVIIRDWRRYESGGGMVPIPVMEVKQMSGRAGRPGYDEYGEAVLVAGNKRDERVLFERYIKGRPEDIKSRLGSESALRTHVLAFIAGGIASTGPDLVKFLRRSLFAFQGGSDSIRYLAEEVLAFLVKEELAREEANKLSVTRFGRRVSELYIDPLSAVLIRQGLTTDLEKSNFGLLHTVSRTPDMMKLRVRQSEIDWMLSVFSAHADDLLLPEKKLVPTEEMLSEIKTTALLTDWIGELGEDKLTSGYDIGPGDLHSVVELADWLLYSAQQTARIFRLDREQELLDALRMRVMYGVRQELLPLVSLKGIGRKRSRNLFNAGYKTARDIARADLQDLDRVPSIGRAVADDIRRQVTEETAA